MASDPGHGEAEAAARLESHAQGVLRLDDPAVEIDFGRDGVDEPAVRALPFGDAFAAMDALEGGAIANPDEGRRVGHYWLRAPGLAPEAELGEAIRATIDRLETFAEAVRTGAIAPPAAPRFERVLLVGIGGSALGPMLVDDALGRHAREVPGATGLPLTVLDNTDPDGIRSAVRDQGDLRTCLVLVVSKSGGTPETRNGMVEVRAAYERQGLAFGPHAVAVTGEGSKLAELAAAEGFVDTFPIPDWVGGRTSVFAAVGLLPAALGGVDVRGLLAGAAAMDAWTRGTDPLRNPAARLAATWHVQGGGQGDRNLVVLPYRDRLVLLARYLQQLVMESLGKRLDRKGQEVFQGLTVFGNKGSTDQHAFVQQLRDGRKDFVALFVRVLGDSADGETGHPGAVGCDAPVAVDDQGATSGDYLDGFWQGTRAALSDSGRPNVTITLESLDARALGAVVALFERAVGLYAELIDVNAYHQPGVEAGKKAASAVLAVQKQVLDALSSTPRAEAVAAATLAARIGADPETVWHVLRHLAATRTTVRRIGPPHPGEARFAWLGD